MTGIYGIHNLINDKWYVGQSKNIERRNCTEKSGLRHRNSFHSGARDNIHMVRAWQKYGEDYFEWIVLEECSVDQLNEKEIFWIEQKDSFNNGYNETGGGGGVRGRVISDETRLKMSISRTGKKRSESAKRNISLAKRGNRNPMFGKHLSEETKKKMSISQMKAKKERKPIVCIDTGVCYSSIHEAARKLNITPACISRVYNGYRTKTHGLTFNFIEEKEDK